MKNKRIITVKYGYLKNSPSEENLKSDAISTLFPTSKFIKISIIIKLFEENSLSELLRPCTEWNG